MTEGEVLGSTMENQEKLSEGSVKTLETNETSTRINGVEPNQDQISLIWGIMKRAEEKEQSKILQDKAEKKKKEMQLLLEKGGEEKDKMKERMEKALEEEKEKQEMLEKAE